MLRFKLAFLVAPFPAAFFQSVMVALWPKVGRGVFEHPLSMFAAICLLFYASGLVLGVPLFLLLRKRGPGGLRAYALAGMGVALTPIAVVLGVLAGRGQLSAYVAAYNIVYFGLGGLLAGILFRAVARPDRRPAIRAVAADKARLSETFD